MTDDLREFLRSYIFNLIDFIFSILPYLILCYIVTRWVNEKYLFFFKLLGGIVCFEILVWIWKSLVSWLFFYLWGRNSLARRLEDMLFEDGFPPPAVDDTNIETFFMEVAHDENMDHLQFSW